MLLIRDMICGIREKQAAWHLTSEERKASKEYIEALEAAAAALDVQVYA